MIGWRTSLRYAIDSMNNKFRCYGTSKLFICRVIIYSQFWYDTYKSLYDPFAGMRRLCFEGLWWLCLKTKERFTCTLSPIGLCNLTSRLGKTKAHEVGNETERGWGTRGGHQNWSKHGFMCYHILLFCFLKPKLWGWYSNFNLSMCQNIRNAFHMVGCVSLIQS